MKNIFSPIRASWWVLDLFSPPEPKNVWFQLSRIDVRRVHEKLFSRRYERAIGRFTHFGFLSPKTFDSYFRDIMYVKFMKKFFLPIRSNRWVLDTFPSPEPKNVWFFLSRHDVRRVHEKISSRPFVRCDECQWRSQPDNLVPLCKFQFIIIMHFFRNWLFSQSVNCKYLRSGSKSSGWLRYWWVLDSFRPAEAKNVWFHLYRHHVRRVHEKFFSRWFERTIGC